MTDLDPEQEVFDAYREWQELLARKREVEMQKIISEYGKNSPITFSEKPTTDEYGTITVGQYGGYYVQIMPMVFNDRVILTPMNAVYGYDHGWCFDKGGAALLAVLAWDPDTQGEPPGYKKRATGGLREPGETAQPDNEIPVWVYQVASRWGLDLTVPDQPNGR